MPETRKIKRSQNGPHQINVVCHGLMVGWFNSRDKRIVVRLPAVPSHAYGAGSWGSEVELTPDAYYQLEGVQTGAKDTSDKSKTILLDRVHGDLLPNRSKIFCTIELPFPDEMRELRSVSALPAGFFHGSAQVTYQIAPATLSMVQVFSYTSIASDTPRLVGDTGRIWESPGGAQNLHVFAGPAFRPTSHHWPHLLDSFQQQLDLHPHDPSPPGPPALDGSGASYGVTAEETMSLAERLLLPNAQPVPVAAGGQARILSGPPPICMMAFVK